MKETEAQRMARLDKEAIARFGATRAGPKARGRHARANADGNDRARAKRLQPQKQEPDGA